ncbi:MAG: putative O-glycosylation ligase, exosortase A system-associated [Burkholderiales bacterium]|nr:putative O-glycosylation ligase, exosortase A system-associated [Burkholderiales bacterium]
MRDLLLFILIAGGVLYGLRAPWVAIIGWTWISMMNPHGLSYRLNDAPVAQAFAISALLGMLFSREPKPFPLTREIVLLIVFMIWMTITTLTAIHFDPSFEMWKRVMKIDVMVLATLLVIYTRQHLMAFVWIVAASLAFYGVKGGLFTIATGGAYRVWGPGGGYIQGNNEVGLALVMTIPLMYFLRDTLTHRWARFAMLLAMLLCAAAVLGTHSRGALLAVAAMAVVMWWRSGKRLVGLAFLPLVGVALLTFMPEHWWDRMGTIKTYDEDDSALGRLNAWIMAYNLAKDYFMGGGYAIITPELFLRYAPEPDRIHAAHSIYFMVLGEHGFVGLTLFLAIFTLAFLSAGRLRKQALKHPETKWLSPLGAMCQVSLVGYAVGGAFLSLSYWDMPYNIVLMIVIGNQWIAKKRWLVEGPVSPNPLEPLMFWRKKPAKAATPKHA